MSALFRWVVARHLLREWRRTLLTVAGVALGVGVFVSIRLANHSALASFADTVDAVAGRANLQVVAGGEGFDERVFLAIRGQPGVEAAAPVVQVDVLAAPGGARDRAADAGGDPGAAAAGVWNEALLVLGVDPLLEPPFGRAALADSEAGDSTALALLVDPRAAAVTRTFAARHRLGLGDTLPVLVSGRPVTLRVRMILASRELQQAYAGNVVLVDIAAAQELFHRAGRLDRVDLIVDPARRDEVRAALSSRLPPGVEARTPEGRTRQVENMVRAFALNLQALSFIALFVATFLIFNAVGTAVVRRRREIGILRALGLTRRATLGLILAEGLAIGAAGSALGLALGTGLARITLGAVSRTLTDLYLVQHAATLAPDAATYLVGGGLGLAAALIASLAPALEAASVPPAFTVRQGDWIEARPVPAGRLALLGAALLVLAAAVAWWTVRADRPFGGFLSAFLILAGGAALAPAFSLAVESLSGPVLRRLFGWEAALGARSLRDAVARTSAVVASILVAVGMMVALTVMVTSFRHTVDTWVTQTLRGDLYVEPVGHRLNGSTTVLPAALTRAVGSLAGVAAMDTYRSSRIVHRGRIAWAVGIDFAIQRDRGRLRFVAGETRAILDRALRRDEVVVTESFAHHHAVAVGDSLDLDAVSGRIRRRIAGVFYDYSTEAGAVLMDRGLYARLWQDDRVESFALYLKPGADPAGVRAALLEQAARAGVLLHVMPNQLLRERVLTVFDQTFRITWALQAIAVLVSVLGVVGALTALVLQRGREVAVLRAGGALRRQIRTMVLAEGAVLGLAGGLLGCGAGLALALLLIHVINRQFFGWTLATVIEPRVFVQAMVLMVATAMVAGMGPARLAADRPPVAAMRTE